MLPNFKKCLVICLISYLETEMPIVSYLKMIENAFYFNLKAFSVFKIFNFFLKIFKVSFKPFDIINWETNN